jgi:hypothetical protein
MPDESLRHLPALLHDLSDGELSVLWQALETEGDGAAIHLTTTTGSANDRLWSAFARLGWMAEVTPHELPEGTKLFTLVPEGREPMRALLVTGARQRVANLFNRLCREMPPQIATPVISAGGTPADVAMTLAGIVEATMRRFIKPNLHDEFLKAVADRAGDLRRHHAQKSASQGNADSAQPRGPPDTNTEIP